MLPHTEKAYTKDESIEEKPRSNERKSKVESDDKMPSAGDAIVLPDRFHQRIRT